MHFWISLSLFLSSLTKQQNFYICLILTTPMCNLNFAVPLLLITIRQQNKWLVNWFFFICGSLWHDQPWFSTIPIRLNQIWDVHNFFPCLYHSFCSFVTASYWFWHPQCVIYKLSCPFFLQMEMKEYMDGKLSI